MRFFVKKNVAVPVTPRSSMRLIEGAVVELDPALVRKYIASGDLEPLESEASTAAELTAEQVRALSAVADSVNAQAADPIAVLFAEAKAGGIEISADDLQHFSDDDIKAVAASYDVRVGKRARADIVKELIEKAMA